MVLFNHISSPLSRVFAVMLASLALLSGGPLRASCCSSSAGTAIGHLLAHERALIDFSHNTTYSYGNFTDNHRFHGGTSAFQPYLTFNHQVHAMVRATSFLLPFVTFPLRAHISGKSHKVSFGDISLGIKAPVLSQGDFYNLFSTTLVFTTRIPTATTLSGETDANAANMGSWHLMPGIALEKSVGPFVYLASYGADIEISRAENQLQSPVIHTATLGATYSHNEFHSFGASLSGTYAGNVRYDGIIIPTTHSRKHTVTLSYMFKFHSHLSANFSLGSDIPIHFFGANKDCTVFAKIGLRAGVF